MDPGDQANDPLIAGPVAKKLEHPLLDDEDPDSREITRKTLAFHDDNSDPTDRS